MVSTNQNVIVMIKINILQTILFQQYQVSHGKWEMRKIRPLNLRKFCKQEATGHFKKKLDLIRGSIFFRVFSENFSSFSC
jgi:hypothetical protein